MIVDSTLRNRCIDPWQVGAPVDFDVFKTDRQRRRRVVERRHVDADTAALVTDERTVSKADVDEAVGRVVGLEVGPERGRRPGGVRENRVAHGDVFAEHARDALPVVPIADDVLDEQVFARAVDVGPA